MSSASARPKLLWKFRRVFTTKEGKRNDFVVDTAAIPGPSILRGKPFPAFPWKLTLSRNLS